MLLCALSVFRGLLQRNLMLYFHLACDFRPFSSWMEYFSLKYNKMFVYFSRGEGINRIWISRVCSLINCNTAQQCNISDLILFKFYLHIFQRVLYSNCIDYIRERSISVPPSLKINNKSLFLPLCMCKQYLHTHTHTHTHIHIYTQICIYNHINTHYIHIYIEFVYVYGNFSL